MSATNASGRSLRSRVLAGELTVGVFVGLGSAVATEICASDVDWVLIDLEHGSSTDADLLPQLLAMSGTRATPLVRVALPARTLVSKALDLGAAGIMFPRSEGVADAQAAVTMTRYPPSGIRGVASQVRSAGFGAIPVADIGTTGEPALGVIQIETLGALSAVEEIAKVDGVDVLFVGPGDLTYSLGVPGRYGADEYLVALDRVVAAAVAADRAAGVLARDTDDATIYYDRGFRFIAIGSDSGYLRTGIAGVSSWAAAKASRPLQSRG